jgi:hypothetical protein
MSFAGDNNETEPHWVRQSQASAGNRSSEQNTRSPSTDSKGKAKLIQKSKHERGCFLTFILIVNVFTAALALTFVVSQVVAIILEDSMQIPQFVVRGYGVVFGLSMILIEIGWPEIVKENILSHSWICRGFAYAFIGTLALEEADEGSFADSAKYFLDYMGYFVCGIGALYFVMGCLCLKGYHTKLIQEHDEKLARSKLAKEIQEENFTAA